MAVHVARGRGVMVYRFWPIPILTPAWFDLSTNRFALRVNRRLNLMHLTRSRAYVVGRDI